MCLKKLGAVTMSKIDQVIAAINEITKADDEELEELLEDFIAPDETINAINEYEKKVAKRLRAQKKRFADGIKDYIGKDDDSSIKDIFNYVKQDLFAADEFSEELSIDTQDILELTVGQIAGIVMDDIDEEVVFEELSGRTIIWIEQWSEELGNLMQLHSHEAIEKEFTRAIEAGDGIDTVINNIKDLPQFDRQRARTTAITEILTAHSVAQYEGFLQSPAVKKKKWKHSGTKAIEPRENHMDMDGQEVEVEEQFALVGADGGTYYCDYPRDTTLPAGERIKCHCTMGPVVDPDIIKLTPEEKEQIRQEVLAGLS